MMLGDFRTAEMASADRAIADYAESVEVRRVDGIGEAVRCIGEQDWTADLVVIAHNWSNEYNPSDVGRLLQAVPLARWICCYGPWCESDGRSHDVWPPAVRVPARLFEGRLRRELAVLRGEIEALPLTAGRDEIFAFDHPGRFKLPRQSAVVRVISSDRTLAVYLQETLITAGYQVAAGAGAEPADAVLWDVDPLRSSIWEQVRDFHQRHPQVAILALATFPHRQDVERLLDSGASVVVPKRTCHAGLLETLERLTWTGSGAVPSL